MIDGRCYDAHWAKEKTKAQSALVTYPMPQCLNEPNLELKIYAAFLEILLLIISH